MLVWVQGSPFHIAAGSHPVLELAQFPVTARGSSGVREADLRARQREGTGSYTIQLMTFLQA